MTTVVKRLVYTGNDSPRGKVYVAAWDDDAEGLVGWGPGTAQPSTFKWESAAKAQTKFREKWAEGYVLVGEWKVPEALPVGTKPAGWVASVTSSAAALVPGGGGAAAVTPAESAAPKAKPLRPQLAEPSDRADAGRHIGDPAWVAEEKLNGQRVLCLVDNGVVTLLGRNGQNRKGKFPTEALAGLDLPNIALDGELVDGVYHVFDLPRAVHLVTEADDWDHRRMVLESLFATWKPDPAVVRLVAVAATAEAKQSLHDRVLAAGGEGVVFKLASARYHSGRRSADWIKCKFVSEVDVIVHAIGEEDHNSVSVSVIDPDRTPALVAIGKASLIGKESWGIKVGDVVTVRYLEALDPKAPRLTQCRLVCGPRADKAAAECTLDQLRFTNRGVNS